MTGLLLVLLEIACSAQILQGPHPTSPLLQRAAGYLNTPYPRKANLDAALRLARKAVASADSNDARWLIANVYLRREQPDSAELLLPVVDDRARFYILLGLSHLYRDNEDEDRKMLAGKAMSFVLRAKAEGTLQKIMVAREIACIHAFTQDTGAEAELLRVVHSLEGIRYPYLHFTYYELAVLEIYLGNYDKALNYSQQALRSMSRTKDSTAAADIFFIHGVILRQLAQNDSSLSYVERSIQYYKVQYGDQTLGDAIHYLAETMVKLNRTDEAEKEVSRLYAAYPPESSKDSMRWFASLATFYRLTKDFAHAQQYAQSLVDLQVRLHYQADFYHLGQVYLEAGNYVKAKPYLQLALASTDYAYNVSAKAHLEYCLFLADSATGDYIGAIRHLLQNKRYDDTVMKRAKMDAVEKYQTQYETNLKDQKIALLLKEQELQGMYLERARFIKNLAVYGSLALLIVGILMNVQYRQKKRAHKQLQRALSEKEWLLKEMHHRIKNNLHTIICLLESQSMYLEKDALQAIEKSQHRIYAMSLIHQMLYQNDDFQSIDMSVYLEEFIGYLKDSFDTQQTSFLVDVQPVRLDLQQAIDVALIINEGVTNAIKYAFGDHDDPRVRISMTLEGEKVTLVIADNGNGFQPKEEDFEKSLGMQLIRGLSKELRGTVKIEADSGTRLTIEFFRERTPDPIQQMHWTTSAYEV